jgi:hypothetical protein
MPLRQTTQRVLFAETESPPLPQLPRAIQVQLFQHMVQWFQTVAVKINEEARDEQDYR